MPKDASVWRRFVGMGYEAFLLVGPVMVVAFFYSFLVGQTDHAEEGKRAGLQLVLYFMLLGYFAWGWSLGRVTLPMQTLQLKVVDSATGGPITRLRAFTRAFVGSLALVSGLWLIVSLVRRDRQTPHDLITRTRLVHVPRPRPS